MTDVFTKAKRSAVMARIRGAGNKDTELRLIALMRVARITGWRRGRTIKGEAPRAKFQEASGASVASGARGTGRKAKHSKNQAEADESVARAKSAKAFRVRPDFVFSKERVAVFVDGCFWHGCPLHATWPKQNAEFWLTKISKNQARDRLVNRELRKAGWRVLRVWEHELTRKNTPRLLRRVNRFLSAANPD